jgi:hypothetical protein
MLQGSPGEGKRMKKLFCLASIFRSAFCMAQQDLSIVDIIPHQLSDNLPLIYNELISM